MSAAPVQPRLVLAPASERGWFGGRGLVATAPVEVRSDVTLARAAEALEAEFEGRGAGLTAVLAAYDGTCTVVAFSAVEPAGRDAVPGVASAGVTASDSRRPLLVDAAWSTSPRAYRRAVEEVRERIAAGDVYVLNLTSRLAGSLAVESPAAAFGELVSRASADMAALLEGLPGVTPWIASVSPERFVRVRRESASAVSRRLVEVCPIKGTRPRGATPDDDRLEALELSADEKEHAEHVMIVDLERNDLGVWCVPGSVHVEPLCEVFATPYCHQMVSTVRGVLSDEATFAGLLEAAFPCGSVTGAPKRAAMRIIGELEAAQRGAYCGALLVAVPGELDSSVLIRTLEGESWSDGDGASDGGGRAAWGAGCGITHDSDAGAEALEVLLKASPVTGDGRPAVALRETMRVVRGRVPLLAGHLARLASGGCGPGVLASVRSAVAAALADADPAATFGRLAVTVSPDGRVHAALSTARSSLHVADGPLLIPVTVAGAPPLPAGAAKPADRSAWDAAAAVVGGAAGGGVQAVLVAPDGTLIDGATANVWLVLDGRLVTPPAPPAVAGVAREVVFDVAAELGIEAQERPVTLFELELATEVFFSNALAGVVAARGRGGAVSRRIEDAFRGRLGVM